jgi:hypothetical protein
MFEAYDSLPTQVAAYRDTTKAQDNASRIDINFAARSKIMVFAGTEWSQSRSERDSSNLSGHPTPKGRPS